MDTFAVDYLESLDRSSRITMGFIELFWIDLGNN